MDSKPLSPQKKNEIQAVIFDMDGLMFNTEDLYDQTGHQIMESFGKTFTKELKLKIMGRTSRQACQMMVEYGELPISAEEVMVRTELLFEKLIPEQIRKMKGLDEVFGLAKSIGCPVGLATSSKKSLMKKKLAAFSMESEFDKILTGEDVQKGKPHPEIYQKICGQMNVFPENTVVFEDSFLGSTASAEAGSFTVAVPSDVGRNQDFSHADLVVEALNDLQVIRILQNGSFFR